MQTKKKQPKTCINKQQCTKPINQQKQKPKLNTTHTQIHKSNKN